MINKIKKKQSKETVTSTQQFFFIQPVLFPSHLPRKSYTAILNLIACHYTASSYLNSLNISNAFVSF